MQSTVTPMHRAQLHENAARAHLPGGAAAAAAAAAHAAATATAGLEEALADARHLWDRGAQGRGGARWRGDAAAAAARETRPPRPAAR
jgi:hypothetical protein